MLDPITIRYPIRPRRRSLAVGAVCDLFGLSPAEAPLTVCENLTLDVTPTQIVLFTGPSGSGKSSLLQAVGRQLHAVDAARLTFSEVPLVEGLAGELPERLARLAAAGLAEARLLLRTPAELSDGQRYRFRLALALQQAGPGGTVQLDEFGANLDRALAQVLAHNLRKQAERNRTGALCATTHEDLTEDLNPDVHVRCRGDGRIEVEHRSPVKKNRLAWPASSGFPREPVWTGRTSLGGIIDRTTSASSAE